MPITTPKGKFQQLEELAQRDFLEWARQNNVQPLYDRDYDYRGAWKAGLRRSPSLTGRGHFSDEFKLPSHQTFSNESKYFRPGMRGGAWMGDTYVPFESWELLAPQIVETLNRMLDKWR